MKATMGTGGAGRSKRVAVALAVAGLGVAVLGVGAGAAGAAPGCAWTGRWSTRVNGGRPGPMTLRQSGVDVSGTYSTMHAGIRGRDPGDDVLSGTFDAVYGPDGFQFHMSADCNSFTGSYGTGTWNGTRIA